MAFDYHAAKFELRNALPGRIVTDPATHMIAEQQRHFRGKNFMTDDTWAVRRVGAYVVEVTYSWFLDHPLYGLTVYPLDGDPATRMERGHELSDAHADIPSIVAAVRALEPTDGRA